ncbi:hypothetical protein RB614_34335 [Phytohabitans sp. ZYX-F-186]|uniref:Excalibur calcium-binding domain-containing protein n=1 Tax=Phytohabitans maris TaxID=3071409 RepID=A0ABU0ZRI0_9ACTN|nr:hypothetical protein [Phytohabitans sp. ZYX-F-186]MDQ7909611.1 hypothetical protein [Phytohabitans sp. ZYX-F-186]
MSRWYGALTTWLRARSRRQRYGIVAVAVALLLGLGGLVVAGGSETDILWFDGRPVAAPADEPEQELGGATEPERESGQRQPAGAVEPPPPYVQPFAEQPGAKPRAPLPSPTAGVEIEEGTDGCDHAYGDRDVCVPWEFPAGVTDKCGWLRERGFGPLKITGGRDRHGLDRNGDGTACGDGD